MYLSMKYIGYRSEARRFCAHYAHLPRTSEMQRRSHLEFLCREKALAVRGGNRLFRMTEPTFVYSCLSIWVKLVRSKVEEASNAIRIRDFERF